MFFIRGTVDWSCFSWLQEGEEGRAEGAGWGLEEGREGDLEMETWGPKMEGGERGGRREGRRGQGRWEPGESVRKGVGEDFVSLSGVTVKL